MGKDKAKGLKKKGSRSLGSSSSMNDKTLATLMVSSLAMHNERVMEMKKEECLAFLEISMREVEIRDRELAMQEYKQLQKDTMFYFKPYDLLNGDARGQIEEIRTISAKGTRNKRMDEESSKSTKKKGKKVKVAQTIKDENNSQDTLDREIKDSYKHEEEDQSRNRLDASVIRDNLDSEATHSQKEEEDDDEVYNVENCDDYNDDDDDDVNE
uniref:Uncharacterized protein n=1 Tax=Tanacetum cinerariifolium TaxID=118510 RepID=A0A699H193_TANCI|nr:hypothetical protein [Tanacetum cinerariifolium]